MNRTRLLALTAAPLALVLTPTLAAAMTPELTASATTVSTTPSTAADDGSPVLRVRDVLSNGSDRHTRILQAWTDCLVAAGSPTLDPDSEPRPVPAETISATYGVTLAWPPSDTARAACEDRAPVYPAVLEARTNPTFAAQAQSYVACLREHGEWVRLLNDRNLDWTYRAGHDVPDENAAIEDACLLATFGD